MHRLLALAFCVLIPATTAAQSCPLTLDRLKRMSEAELEQLFDQAPPGPVPNGYTRGQVLLMTDARMPRLKARLGSVMWKGKHFDDDGGFINQWAGGFRALRGHAEPGVSWHDGKPCIVVRYPHGTPVFGNTWDELREVAPGLYLARLYERCPCPRFRGYFAIEATCR
jgi:hypothetical protein